MMLSLPLPLFSPLMSTLVALLLLELVMVLRPSSTQPLVSRGGAVARVGAFSVVSHV